MVVGRYVDCVLEEPMDDTKTVLKIVGLSKAFPGVQALDRVDMQVRTGEVHCLVGENGSGKSTLISSVSGAQPFDSGEIELNGTSYSSLTPKLSMREGVQVIFQDMSLFPHLSVAENIAFNWMLYNKRKLVHPKIINERAKAGLQRLGEDLDLRAPVQSLTMAQKQIVAIARAIVLDAKIIFMDEPTTALAKHEIETLFKIIDGLRENGISTVFVSHKLDEVFRVSDNITVLRDGKKVGDFVASDLDEDSLAYHMTGQEVLYREYNYTPKPNVEPVIKLQNLTREPHFRNVDLEVHPGEIVGITGPLGAGRTELALAVFGLNRPQSGRIYMGGKEVHITSPKDAIENGIALVPEDRHLQGLFEKKSIADNLIASILDRLTRRTLIDQDKSDATAQQWFKNLRVKAASPNIEVRTLSGGNQQRVVIGKWLATQPKLLILDGPTVGIDIASKSSIHEMVHALAEQGMAIIIISDEIPEVYKNSSRLIVMREGEFIHESRREDIDQDAIRNLIETGQMGATA